MDEVKLNAALARINEFKNAVLRQYTAGLLSDNELDMQLYELQVAYREALRELGLRDVHARNRDTMKRYELDYRLWASGKKPDAADGEPWLLRIGGESEASSDERAALFALAKDALLEIFAFDFPPDDIEKPVRHLRVYDNGTRVIVPFDCVDDGGLLACDDPRGKRFFLTASNGLHAMIEIDEGAGLDYRPSWKAGSQYRGLIAVEGYTVEGLHSKGAVNIAHGKIDSVSYTNSRWVWHDDAHIRMICDEEEIEATDAVSILTRQGERNEEAFRGYPRWQACFAWERKHPPRLLSPSRKEYIDALLKEVGS